MTISSTSRVPTLWHGHGITRRVTEQLTGGRDVFVLADTAVTSSVPIGGSARTMTLDAPATDTEAVSAIARELAHRPPDVIVAVGGGSIIDACKVAALVLGREGLFDYAIGHASASALTLLPDAPPPVDLIAVPTTLGTSSETNSVAILRNSGGYRLIIGRALRPRHAIVDSGNLSTLRTAAVFEGALEAFLRLAGASTSARRSARARHDARRIARALIETATRDPASAAGRLRIARLSGATQRTAALRGLDPYSARHWYVANEVAFGLGVRKMIASAAVVAAIWRRICAADSRWGDRPSLEVFWAEATEGSGLPLDPPTGFTALVDRWGIPRPPQPQGEVLDRVAATIERAWGDRRPMLAGLRADDFRDVLRDAWWSDSSAGEPRRPSTTGAKEVK